MNLTNETFQSINDSSKFGFGIVCDYNFIYLLIITENSTKNYVFSSEADLLIRTLVACLPAWFRFAQCLRRYKDDSRGIFPHLINAGKYSTTFFVVIFSTLTELTISNDQLFINYLLIHKFIGIN